MKATRYILFLASKNGYFLKKIEDGMINETIVTFNIEEAKLYMSYGGAEKGARQLYNDLPQIMTVEIEITPIAMGEVITREAIDQRKIDKLEGQIDKKRQEILENWNREQGIDG